MTAVLDAAAPKPRSLPPIFDRMVWILTAQSHLFALLILTGNWRTYRSGVADLAVLLLSLSIAPICLMVARRTGGVLSQSAFLTAGIAVIGVDVGATTLLPPHSLGAPAAWTWGVVGVTVLTLIPFRPAADILTLGMVHGGTALVIMTWAYSRGDADLFRLLADVSAAVLPALAAAQFAGLYVSAVREQHASGLQLSVARARTEATASVAADTARRLAWLRAETLPLLQAVATSTTSMSDPTTMMLAQRLSTDLRRELVQDFSGSWLLTGRTDAVVPGFTHPEVLDPQRLLSRLTDEHRTALAAFVEVLGKGHHWERLTVILTRTEHEDSALEDVAELTVVALGDQAEGFIDDPVLAVTARSLNGSMNCEGPRLLVTDALLSLRRAP